MALFNLIRRDDAMGALTAMMARRSTGNRSRRLSPSDCLPLAACQWASSGRWARSRCPASRPPHRRRDAAPLHASGQSAEPETPCRGAANVAPHHGRLSPCPSIGSDAQRRQAEREPFSIDSLYSLYSRHLHSHSLFTLNPLKA